MASAVEIIRYMAFYCQEGCGTETLEYEDLAGQIKHLFGGTEYKTSEKFDELYKDVAMQIVNGFISGLPIFYEYNDDNLMLSQFRDWKNAPEADIVIDVPDTNCVVRCWIIE